MFLYNIVSGQLAFVLLLMNNITSLHTVVSLSNDWRTLVDRQNKLMPFLPSLYMQLVTTNETSNINPSTATKI